MQRIVIDQQGNTKYYDSKDRLHRQDGPAVLYANGDYTWYYQNKRHRTDGPAMDWTSSYGNNKTVRWFIHGVQFKRDQSIPLQFQVALLLLES